MSQVIISHEYALRQQRKQKNQQRLQRLKPFYMSVLDLIELCGGTNTVITYGHIGALAGQLATELYIQIYERGIYCLSPEKMIYPTACIGKKERDAIIAVLKDNERHDLVDSLCSVNPIYEPAIEKGDACNE